MNRRHPPALLVGLLLACFAIEAPAVDLLQVYRDARDGDPQLRAADASRQAAGENKPQAVANLLPQIGASLERDHDSAVRGLNGVSSYNSHSYGVTLTQPIFRKENYVQLRRADALVGQAEADYADADQQFLLRVATRYFTVLASLDNLRFARAEKDAVARELEQARRRFDVGLVTVVDVQEAQARHDLTVAQEITAENTLEDAREALRVVTGQEYGPLDELGERMPLKMPDPARVDPWIDRALANNPTLRSAQQAADAAKETVDLQRAGHYPSLDLVASHYDNDFGPRGGDLSGNRVGIQVNIPLFQGGAVTSRTRQAAYQHEAAREQVEATQRDIVRQVRNAHRGQQAAISQVKALKQALVSNRSSLDATRAGLDVGTRTIVDVLDAERELYRAERDYAKARYDYVLNRLLLKQAAGDLGEADLVEVNAWLQRPKP
ncbi:TolC family outer membrane protein [Plasticicumulans sp.]|uniref:TolC family outer membrane protein n=1 Tax=Plasticicumulans sp. TaxID=2307179 RepID=UPI003936C8F6